jgi:hypothetical protein
MKRHSQTYEDQQELTHLAAENTDPALEREVERIGGEVSRSARIFRKARNRLSALVYFGR